MDLNIWCKKQKESIILKSMNEVKYGDFGKTYKQPSHYDFNEKENIFTYLNFLLSDIGERLSYQYEGTTITQQNMF